MSRSRYLAPPWRSACWSADLRSQPAPDLLRSNEDGAQTSLHCLLDDDAPNHSGAYFSQNENAHDDAMAGRLADVSRELVGLRA